MGEKIQSRMCLFFYQFLIQLTLNSNTPLLSCSYSITASNLSLMRMKNKSVGLYRWGLNLKICLWLASLPQFGLLIKKQLFIFYSTAFSCVFEKNVLLNHWKTEKGACIPQLERKARMISVKKYIKTNLFKDWESFSKHCAPLQQTFQKAATGLFKRCMWG